MRSSIVLAILVAAMTPYLPFWRFDNDLQPILVTAITYLIARMYIYADEVEKHD